MCVFLLLKLVTVLLLPWLQETNPNMTSMGCQDFFFVVVWEWETLKVFDNDQQIKGEEDPLRSGCVMFEL